MTHKHYGNGISRKGLDSAFDAAELQKSNLLLEADILREQGRSREAAANFAHAAAIEEQLRDQCASKGLTDKSFLHAFSAAGCWAQAGDLYHAAVLCDALLEQPTLPERLRRRVQQYSEVIRNRRDAWYTELLQQRAGAEI